MSYPPPPGPYGQQPGPYGQQPGWGQQLPGYPPQGQPQGAWPQMSAGGPPPPPKKDRTGLIVLLSLVAVLVIGGGIVTAVVLVSSSGKIEAGDCISVDQPYATKVQSETCGSAGSDYKVSEVVSGGSQNCPKGTDAWGEGKQTYCLYLDARAGDCLAEYSDDPKMFFPKVGCTDPGQKDQVTKVTNSSNFDSECADGEGFHYFTPPLSICTEHRDR